MTTSDEKFWSYFHELFESIPRQGVGLNRITRKALEKLPQLNENQNILDIGCGSGTQTIELAQRCAAHITATDLHAPFIKILERRAAELGLSGRISTRVADMADLPFEDNFFDVIWSEGAVFIIGFAQALVKWRRLLKPGGYMAISEFTWFAENPPDELREYCVPNPSDDASLTARRKAVVEADYELIDEFPLPVEAWTEGYYAPLKESLDEFERRYASVPAAMDVAKRSRYEMELFDRYREYFGYTFYIMKTKS